MIFEQGDIVEVNFNPTVGHEPAKTRPALVVSNYDFNISNSMTIVCPITNRLKPFFLHFDLPEHNDITGCIVAEQVRAIDLDARSARKIGELDTATLNKVLVCIKSFFS